MKDIYEKNANIEMNVDRSGWNGLHHAAAAGQMKPIEIMLYWNFDVNAVTNDNETPILLATRSGHKSCVNFIWGSEQGIRDGLKSFWLARTEVDQSNLRF